MARTKIVTGPDGFIDEAAFAQAVHEYVVEPREHLRDVIVELYFVPIALPWARFVSFTQEDTEDAVQELLLHMAEKIKQVRRARFDSPIRRKPVAGFEIGRGKVFAMFWQCAKWKAYDIVKSRVRAYVRECSVEEAALMTAVLRSFKGKPKEPLENAI